MIINVFIWMLLILLVMMQINNDELCSFDPFPFLGINQSDLNYHGSTSLYKYFTVSQLHKV